MNIQCTQKLLDKLKLPVVQSTEPNAFMDWHASYLLINRHHTVLLLNNLCRYALVFHGLKAADFKKMPFYFQQALTEILLAEDVDQTTVDHYFALAGPICFTKTSDRSITAQLAKIGMELPRFAENFDVTQIVQSDFNLWFGALKHSIGQDYICPSDLMQTAMNQFKRTGQTQFERAGLSTQIPTGKKAFVLSIELPCGDRSILRRLAVSAKCTFGQLHRYIQSSFNWLDMHLHQFQVVSANGDIVAQTESAIDTYPGLEPPQSLRIFTELKRIAAFMPEYRSIHYRYDFGDDWLHLIEIEEIVESFEEHLPCCLDGEGTAPPEDVGGESGYLEFLSVVENESDTADKRELLEWAADMEWRQFDLKEINKRLRWIF